MAFLFINLSFIPSRAESTHFAPPKNYFVNTFFSLEKKLELKGSKMCRIDMNLYNDIKCKLILLTWKREYMAFFFLLDINSIMYSFVSFLLFIRGMNRLTIHCRFLQQL